MADIVAIRLAVVGAAYSLYLIGFFVFGRHVFGVDYYFWLTTAVTLLLTGLVAVAMRRSSGVQRTFFALLAGTQVFDTLGQFTFQRHILRVGVDGELWMIFATLFHFGWACSWGYLALKLINRHRSTRIVNALAALMLVGLVSVYLLYLLLPDGGPDLAVSQLAMDTTQQRFLLVFRALELVSLMFGIVCVLSGVGASYVLMIFGYSVFAAADFVLITRMIAGDTASSGALDPIWNLGKFLILAGMVILPQLRNAGAEPSDRERSGQGTGVDSPLSGWMVLYALGSVFVVGTVAVLLSQSPGWLAFALVLFSMLTVIAMTQFTTLFDSAIDFSRSWSTLLFRKGLEAPPWHLQDARKGVRRALHVTQLGQLLDTLAKNAEELRGRMIPLGPEPVHPPVKSNKSAPAACFVMMPFSLDWSDEVHSIIRMACKRSGVRAIRGDDIYSPTDIMDDIWHGINHAHFVIADISGRNPNVLYELGIAHTLGKPVVILAQSDEDVPFDLGMRRVLMYDRDRLDDLEMRLAGGIGEVLTLYGFKPEPRRSGELPLPAVAKEPGPAPADHKRSSVKVST